MRCLRSARSTRTPPYGATLHGSFRQTGRCLRMGAFVRAGGSVLRHPGFAGVTAAVAVGEMRRSCAFHPRKAEEKGTQAGACRSASPRTPQPPIRQLSRNVRRGSRFPPFQSPRRHPSPKKCLVFAAQLIENKGPEGVTTTLLRTHADFATTVAQPPPSAPWGSIRPVHLSISDSAAPWGRRETRLHRVRCGRGGRLWLRATILYLEGST